MKNKCKGCGVPLQTNNPKSRGFTKKIESPLCYRCYQLQNFNQEYEYDLTNKETMKIVEKAIKDFESVILVVDVCNLHASINPELIELLSGKKVFLVANKIDILPQVIRPLKIINWLERNIDIDFADILLVSAKKKRNIDELLLTLKEEGIKKIPIIGMTNVGKSSIINSLVKSKDPDSDKQIIVSPYSGTTQESINLNIDGIEIIDTPGIINSENVQNYLKKSSLSKLYPKKEYKNKTFQINPGNSVFVSSLLEIDYIDGENIALTVYSSEQLVTHRTKLETVNQFREKNLFTEFLGVPTREEAEYLNEFKKHKLKIEPNQMLMVDGLCWITFNNKKTITIEITLPKQIGFGLANSIFKEDYE